MRKFIAGITIALTLGFFTVNVPASAKDHRYKGQKNWQKQIKKDRKRNNKRAQKRWKHRSKNQNRFNKRNKRFRNNVFRRNAFNRNNNSNAWSRNCRRDRQSYRGNQLNRWLGNNRGQNYNWNWNNNRRGNNWSGHPVHGYNHPAHGAFHPAHGIQNNGLLRLAGQLL